MVVFNLENNKFEIYREQSYFLAIQIDRERGDFKEIIHRFDKKDNWDVLALNNESDESLEKCLEMFSNEDKNFIMLLDFYRFDNKHRIPEIFNIN